MSGYTFSDRQKFFLKMEYHWTTISDAVGALLLGIAKILGSGDDAYPWLYFVAALILLISAGFDIPAAHIRKKDPNRKFGYWTLSFDWFFGTLALFALIAAILAIADHDLEHDALLFAYGLGVAKYSGKIIQKTIKAIIDGRSGSDSH